MANTTMRSTCWSLTINNPAPADEEQINLARQRGWKVEGQMEKGAEGTLHYQLRLMTPQVRFSAVKKAFPRAHIEAARDPIALGKYVTKEATKVADLPQGQDAYPSLSKFWELIYLHYNTDDSYGWNSLSLEEGLAEFYHEDLDMELSSSPLVVLDRAVRVLISGGYHIESLAANPSTRSMWKLYARELIGRSHKSVQAAAAAALQTEDRQTDSVEMEQEVVVPVHTTNDAEEDEEVRSQPPPPSPRCSPPPA